MVEERSRSGLEMDNKGSSAPEMGDEIELNHPGYRFLPFKWERGNIYRYRDLPLRERGLFY